MSEQEKKWQKISYLLNAETKPKFFVYRIQSKEKNVLKKSFLRKRGSRILKKKKRTERFFNCSSYGY